MTRIETLLSRLGTQGVRFWLEGDTLHYRAPRGALDEETMNTLRSRKQELITFLQNNAAENGARTVLPPLIAKGETPPYLSLGQQGLWVLYQMNGSNGTYNIPEALLLRGSLDQNCLQKSLQALVDRHMVLRSRIAESGESAYLHVTENMVVDLPIIDLSNGETEDRYSAALQRVNQEGNAPFDLESGPLFRTCLMRLSDQEHILCLTLHHIIADGWSKGVLSKELAHAYNGYLQGTGPQLEPLKVTYHDCIFWQREQLTDQFLAPHIQYWQEVLKGLPSPASIPTDRFRPEYLSGRGEVLCSELPSDISDVLKEMARASGCTLYMVLATLFSELLRRYRNDNDIVFGTPTANRPLKEMQNLLGFFVNSLVIRVAADGHLTFQELLQRVRKTILDGFAHQIVPFEKVVEALGQRSPSYSPLFQIGFVLQDGTIELPELDGLQVEQIQVERTTAKYDLSFIAVETKDRIVLEWEYATDLFAQGTINQMALSFQQLAGEVVRHPSTPLQSLELCTDRQRALVIYEWSSRLQKPFPNDCLHELFSAVVAGYPDRLAAVCGSERLTYAELDERADAIAFKLLESGCGLETIVAVCLDRSVDMIAAILAILKAGGAYLPLDQEYPEGRLLQMIEDSGAKIVISSGDNELFQRIGLPCIDPGRISLADAQVFFTTPDVRPDTLAYLIYTSGSTGKPKGVMIENRSVANLIAGLEEVVYSQYPGPQQVSLFAATVFDASVQQIFAALCGGHTLHVLDTANREDPRLLLDYWRNENITIADGTPTLLRLLLEAGLAEAEDLQLKHLIIGGEPLPYETVYLLRAGSSGRTVELTNIYGPTECCVDVTFYTCPHDALPELAVMPIGRPMVNARVYILDDLGLPVPPGMVGELYIGGPGVGRGYLGRDDLTAERFIDNPFEQGERLYRTGDRVRFLEDGTIAFIGRTDNQVKVHGFRIEPGEIEHCLRRCEGVEDAVVCVVEQGAADCELLAYLVVEGERVTLNQLHGFLAERLPHYMIPARFYTLSAFPRNSSGKVDRSALGSMDMVPLQKPSTGHCAPRTEKEKLLSAIWQDVLKIEAPSIHDNYFVFGGDSIKALQIVSRLRQHSYQMAIRDIFQHPTIAEQVLLLEVGKSRRADTPVIGAVVLTAIQRWFLEQFDGNRNHFHQAILLQPRRRMNDVGLRRGLESLQMHHDALRSIFFLADTGEWLQEVPDHNQPIDFEVVDYRGAADGFADLHKHSFEVMKETDLARGPLFKAVLYRLADGDRLLLAAHHLVVDGVSWRILLQDFHKAYQQILSGKDTSLGPKTTSFQEWSERLADYGRSFTGKHRALENTSSFSGHRKVTQLYSGPSFTYAERKRCQRPLSSGLTKALQTDAHKAYQTGITDLLLCGFGRAVLREAGIDRLAITLEGHGREPLSSDIELDRTVGWFTMMYPVVFDFGQSDDVGEHIRIVQRAVQRAHASGIEFGLRRWGPKSRPEDRQQPLPSILFNYLGDFDQMNSELFALATEKIGPVIDPEAVVPFDIEVTGMCLGGNIELSIDYGRTLQAGRVQTLMEFWVDELQAIVKHTRSVVARDNDTTTVDYNGLGADEVDSFLNIFTGS
jgi:amino acid adenylation domain-containing protein/non-ribosomal peptide synthase protein (TIGR01720 family)